MILLAGCAARPLDRPAPAVDAPDDAGAPADLRPSPPQASADLGEPCDGMRAPDLSAPYDALPPPDLPPGCGLEPLAVYEGPFDESMAASGDVDGDGYADLVTLAGHHRLALTRGYGDGSFAEPLLFATAQPDGGSYQGLAVGDFDGDGRSDVALAYAHPVGGGGLEVWRGAAHGALVRTLAEPISAAWPYAVSALAAARLDGDAHLDLLELDQGLLRARLGRGDGTFAAPIETPLGQPAMQLMAVGDFDGDGILDAAVAPRSNSRSTTLHLLAGRGDGTFMLRSAITVPWSARSLFAVDRDRDGHLDVVVESLDPYGFGVLVGGGDGTFTVGAVTPLDVEDSPACWLDLDHDGASERLDEAINALRVERGDVQSIYPLPSFEVFATMTAGDFDGDRVTDVLLVGAVGRELLVGDRRGGFVPRPAFGASQPSSAALADFDGDGIPDFVTAGPYVEAVTLRRGHGDGTFGPPEDTPVPRTQTHGYVFRSLLTGDFDGDGNRDVLIGCAYGESSLLRGRGDGTFVPTLVALGGESYAAADLDGDGVLDVITDGATVYRGAPGNTTLRTQASIAATANAPWPGASVVFADVDGDGRTDLAAVLSGAVQVFRNGDGGRFAGPATFTDGGKSDALVAAVDVDGDGHVDLVTRAGGGLAILRGRGDGTFAPAQPVTYGGGAVLLRDFDGDGLPDLVVAHDRSNAAPASIDWSRGNGDGTFAAPVRFALDATPLGAPVAGDLDGDGRPELVAVDTAGNTITVVANRLDGCRR